MRMHKTLLSAIAILLIPAASAFPVIQDVQLVTENVGVNLAGGESGGLSGSPPAPSSLSLMPDTGMPGATETVVDFLTSTNSTSTVGTAGQQELLDQELEAQLQDELIAPAQAPFWRRKSILLLGALLMLGGLFAGLFSGSGSGSGSNGGSGGSGDLGSGGGYGSGGPGGSGGPSILGFNDDNPLNLGGGGDGLGDGGDGSNGDGGNNGVPSNPEPSSMFLLGSGLLAALYARKRRFVS